MDLWIVVVIFVGVAVGVIVGWWLGSIRGQPVLGAILGLLSVFGWFLILLLPRKEPEAVESPASVPPIHEGPRPPDRPSESMPRHPADVHHMSDDGRPPSHDPSI